LLVPLPWNLPWFGLEQEYFMIDPKTTRPVGFPVDGSDPPAQGPYYCGVGGSKLFGRDIVDAHYKACLYSGIKISGINAEVAPGQWEYQVGPATGIEQGDMLWMSRYILERIAEVEGIDICYDAKPVKGDWNGTGCHTNFSTKAMRAPGGYEAAIVPALEKLALKHDAHIAAYGAGNEERLTGKHETASISTFKWGVADRGASCRVGHETKENGCGYVSHCSCTSFTSIWLHRCLDRSSDD
jgi:glutamine synthetase